MDSVIPRPDDLPLPPALLEGWPWTGAVGMSPGYLSLHAPWPKITVVTPSFNQGAFIEKTIRSVLSQGYPNLEYIIMDGGSTDDTVETIKKYERFLTCWESEPDRGQAHAINKGFQRATGDILCWINSDDWYFPFALFHAAAYFRNPGTFITCGNCLQFFKDGSRAAIYVRSRSKSRTRILKFWKGYHLHQPAMFWRREVYERIGPLTESYRYILDFDYWVRVAQHYRIEARDDLIAGSCYHPDAKTGDGYAAYSRELWRNARRYWGPRRRIQYWKFWASMITWPVLGRLRKLDKLFSDPSPF